MCWGNSDTNIWGVTNHSLVGCEAHSEREAMPGTATALESLGLANPQASWKPQTIVLLKKYSNKILLMTSAIHTVHWLTQPSENLLHAIDRN